MAVPVEYRHITKKITVACSLHTTNRKQAIILAGEKRAKLIRDWEQASGSDKLPASGYGIAFTPTTDDIYRAVSNVAYDRFIKVMKNGSERQQAASLSTKEYKDYLSSQEDKLLENARDLDGSKREVAKKVAAYIVKAENWDLPPNTELYEQLVEAVTLASLDAQRVVHETEKGKLDAEPSSKVVVAAKKAAAASAKPGQTIMELFELYATQRMTEGAKRDDGVRQDRTVISLFADYVGPHRSVESISIPEARDFVLASKQLPVNFAKRKAYAGLSMKQVVAKGLKDGDQPISAVTHARYISTVSPFFNWLKSMGYTDTQPFLGLHPHPKKGRNSRPPLSVTQLNQILSSPLFAGYLREGREHLSGPTQSDDWRRWIPLVCLFTGARIGEVAQLHIGDIEKIHGIWFVHLREDEKTNQRTKSGKSRSVPLHPKLQDVGFLEFVERQKQNANREAISPLFPELIPDNRNQLGAKPSRFWRKYLSAIGIKSGPDGFGSHSFRHTIADEFRRAGYRDEEFGPIILGHSNKSVTSGYGILAEGTAQMRLKMIESVKFEGVNFDHLVACNK